MKQVNASIRVNVDCRNPGQFLACCGLLELADRLWPGAEGWFEREHFCIACDGSLADLLETLAEAQLNSSLTDNELKQLGSLLSAAKASLSPQQVAEKERLRAMWQSERLYLGEPFGLYLDWWRDARGDRTELKTWAAKQFVLEIARPLLRAVIHLKADTGILTNGSTVDGLPFYFDSIANSQNTPRDTGFGLYALRRVIKTQEGVRPALELLAFCGLQRFRPFVTSSGREFRYTCWSLPLPPILASVATAQLLGSPGERRFEFRLLNRSKYMKAFLPARPL